MNRNGNYLEIDYDKLAEAIVKAQEKTKEASKKSESRKTRFRNAFLGNFNGIFYHGLSILLIYFIIKIWISFSKHEITSLISCIIFTVMFAVFSIVSFLCGQETFGDDYERSRSLFSTNVSLIALIIAIIALYKNIG